MSGNASDDVWASGFDVLLLDLDGVVYAGDHAIDGAPESLGVCRSAGVRLAFVTNNASRTPDDVAQRLDTMGVPAQPADVVTSAQAGGRMLEHSLDPGARVLVVGGPGLHQAVTERGFAVVSAASDEPAAVIMGFSPDVSWRQLAQATYAINAGALFFATNCDRTIPTGQGIGPGNGLLVGVVVAATGVEPAVAGKPEPPLMLESVDRTKARRPLVVGDRLDTDIAGASAARLPSLLVLSGVSQARDLLTAPSGSRPDFVAHDLKGLVDGPVPLMRASHARPDPDGQLPVHDSWLAALARQAQAAWSAADRGHPFDIDEALASLG